MNSMTKLTLMLLVALGGLLGADFAQSSDIPQRLNESGPKGPAGTERILPPLKADSSESMAKPTGPRSKPHDGRLSLNFFEVDIREVLSAIAMEREINIAMAPSVSGKISVHLFRVTLAQALDTVARAGGVRYRKQGNVYNVYKPKEADDLETKGLEMRIFQLKYADLDKVQGILESIPSFKMVKIHEPTKTIIVEDTPETIRKIEKIVRHWDVRPKQVMIEAKILEVTLTDDMSLGVNWEQLLGNVSLGTGGFSTANIPTTGPISPIPDTGMGGFGNLITGAGTQNQFTAALDALQSKTKVNTLSTPKILAIHGKPARVQVGGQQGYKVTTTNLGVATETIEFIDTGTILEITPYICEKDEVMLDIRPTINSAVIEGGVPVVNSTLVSTSLLARDGDTVFIGGLIQDTKTKTREGVPYFSDLPGLGVLFGRRTRNNRKSELIVLITPKIVARYQPPTADPGGPYSGVEGEAITFDGSGSSHPDKDPLTFEWDFGDGVTATGAAPSHSYSAVDIYTVTLTVSNAKGARSRNRTRAEVISLHRNKPPSLGDITDQNVNEGQALSFLVRGSDPDGDSLDYAVFGLPTGATFDPTADPDSNTFSWGPTNDQGRADPYLVVFSVTDSGGLSHSVGVRINVADTH